MNDCTCDAPKRVVRIRAAKVRKQCTNCMKIGPWEKSEYSNKTKPIHNFGPVVNLPGDKGFTAVRDRADYGSMTVGDLRTIAKDKGLTGYSKMKKDDLIAVLVNA